MLRSIAMAAKSLKQALFACVLISMLVSSSSVYGQTCKTYTNFSNNAVYNACNDLPYLNSFLHWNYDNTSNTVQIAYRHTGLALSRWVAWAVNPTSTRMVGSQAFVAYQLSNGSMRVYKSSVNSYDITTLEESELSFTVGDLSATYINNEITIFATFELPNNKTTLNQLWQEGPVSKDTPGQHDTTGGPNVLSMGTVDFLSGETATTGGGGNSKRTNRNIHGVLNTVSWGIMMPFGAMVARYLKVFKAADPTWFYIHVGCQSLAYIVGVAGWATGIKLGSDSPGLEYTAHRNIGITLFCLGTLQVFALLLRPNKDHKHRLYWNIYHHGVGYAVIILSILNIFKGFDILDPKKIWKTIYIGFIIVLAVNAVSLEVYTWWIVVKRKKSEGEAGKIPPAMANGVKNGYGNRPQSTV